MVVKHVGFGVFYSALSEVADLTNRCVTCGVVERFWHITNIFHFLFKEMTITPLTLPHQQFLDSQRGHYYTRKIVILIMINSFMFLIMLWNPSRMDIIFPIACSSIWCGTTSGGQNIFLINNLAWFSLFFFAWSFLRTWVTVVTSTTWLT